MLDTELFEGMEVHEILLMGLGGLLFFVLIFILLYFVVKNRPIKSILVFFMLPVLMIGFSSFKKIEFLGLIAEFEEKIEKLDRKEDPSEKDKLELNQLITKIEKKRIATSGTLFSISKANAIVGDTLQAIDYAEQSIVKIPESIQVKEFRNSLITSSIIEKGIEKVENEPDNKKARQTLEKQAGILERKDNQNVDNLFISAKAREALGEDEKAAKLTDSVLKLEPTHIEAQALKRRIK